MNPKTALSMVTISTLFFTILGALIGFLLGKYQPNYYRFVFDRERTENFDALAVGIGQGVTQGIVAGGAIGVILVIVTAWYQAKTLRQ